MPKTTTHVPSKSSYCLSRKNLKKCLFHDRDALKHNYNLGQYWVEFNVEDLAAFDESLAEKIYKQPTEYLPVFEEAAKEVADELTAPRPEGEEKVQDIQILLSSDSNPSALRGMKVNS